MSYHAQTRRLLGLPEPAEPGDTSRLERWAAEQGVSLPEAVREIAASDGARLLNLYSNQDSFFFDTPAVVSTSHGPGLLFCVENQGNFGKVVLLGQGDDPPVVFGWLSEEPWVRHAQRFSDCVFAQIFDWQYLLEFDADGHPDIGYAPTVELPQAPSLQPLRDRFAEQVSTHLIVEGVRYDEHRFWRHPGLRLNVLVRHGDGATITVTGEQPDEVDALHAELRAMW